MLDWMLPEKHAIAILKKDHETVKDLLERFEKAKSAAEKDKIIENAVTELKIHAVIEEEVFYPAVRKHVGAEIMNEADEEHHVARVLIAELDSIGRGDDHRDAKFNVLAESVRHHIKEEENEMLPKARELDIDFEALGQKMLERKAELQEDGIPRDAEHAMVARAQGRADSPAATARKTVPAAHKKARKTAASRTRTSKEQRAHAGKAGHEVAPSHSKARSSQGERKTHKVMKARQKGTKPAAAGRTKHANRAGS